MSAPSDVAVWHYDGVSALRRSARLIADGDSFVLVEEERTLGPWRFDALVALDAHGGPARYGLKTQPGWQVMLAEPPPEAVASRLPGAKRYGGPIDRVGLWPAVAVATAVSALVVAVVLNTPSLVARMIPRTVEARMGALMVGDFGGRACSTPAGDAALRTLETRIGAAREGADIEVVDVPIVNAVTLPGGHVLLFSGLINAAASPDEVAGVLGHELGHVDHRDVLTSLVRQLGLSVVLGGFDGNVGGYTNALLSASYSRDAEAKADGYAIDALDRARISPAPTAALFRRLGKGEAKGQVGQLLAYTASHPVSADRAARFAASAKGSFTPALDAAQWQALRAICAGRKASQDGFRF